MKTQLTLMILLAAGVSMAQRQDNNNRQAPSATDLISRLDKDSDGKISESEFDGPAAHFTQFDTNKDGYLSEDEIPSGPPSRSGQESKPSQQSQQRGQNERQGQMQEGDQGGGLVARLDKDGDGQVSQSEFDGPDKVFTELDKNNDGYLSEDEVPSGSPPQGRR